MGLGLGLGLESPVGLTREACGGSLVSERSVLVLDGVGAKGSVIAYLIRDRGRGRGRGGVRGI